MELTLKIDKINYGDIAVKLLPKMCSSVKLDSEALQLTMGAIGGLPDYLVRSVFDAIPVEQKNTILAAFASEHREEILKFLNNLLEQNQIGIELSDFELWSDLMVTAQTERIDYPVLVERFLPNLKELLLSQGGVVAMMRPLIRKASAEQVCGLLDQFLGARKDEILASMVNQNQRALISRMEDMAKKQDIDLTLTSLELKP